MGIQTSLRIKLRDTNNKEICNYEISQFADSIVGFFHDYGDTLYICGQDMKVSEVIPREQAEKYHFKVVRDDGESFNGTTDFFDATEFLDYINRVEEKCYTKSLELTVNNIIDITRWQLTKDTHPRKVKEEINSKFMHFEELIKLKSIIKLASISNFEVQFSAHAD